MKYPNQNNKTKPIHNRKNQSARSIRQQKEKNSKLRRDNKYYVSLESTTEETKRFFGSDYFIPYDFFLPFALRGDSIWNDHLLYLICYDQHVVKQVLFDVHYPLLEFLNVPKYSVENGVFTLEYNKDKALKALIEYFQKNMENNYYGFDIPVISSSNWLMTDHKRAHIEIDFSKPKEQILAFVSKIKDLYDEDNSFIQGLAEHLNLSQPKETVNFSLKSHPFYKHPSIKSLTSKFVDALFIYDCIRFGFSKTYALREIHRYWNNINLIPEQMSNNTVDTYLDFMTDMIDNKRYLEFFNSTKTS